MVEVILFTPLVRLSKSTCDDKSHHVGGKQVITFLAGYTTPLECRSGLMYMSILGKPTDQDLDQYPHVLLTSPHEWIPLYWIMHVPTHMGTLLGLTEFQSKRTLSNSNPNG